MGMITQQDFMQNSLLHFENGVPIVDLHLSPQQKERLARVSHVYWLWVKNPFLDVLPMFKQLVKGKYSDMANENHAAQKDKALFDFVVEHVAPPSRTVQTAKVRAVADRLMRNGMETDNGHDMEAGAKIAMKLDRLDQPESEQADISKVAFLPSVVVTNVKEIDPERENIPDEETRRIVAKYGAFIDPKREMIEEKVALMEAESGIGADETNSEE